MIDEKSMLSTMLSKILFAVLITLLFGFIIRSANAGECIISWEPTQSRVVDNVVYDIYRTDGFDVELIAANLVDLELGIECNDGDFFHIKAKAGENSSEPTNWFGFPMPPKSVSLQRVSN